MNARLGATLTGTIGGFGTLTFNGPGTLQLAAANNYYGATFVKNGTLAVGAGGSINSNNSAISIACDGTGGASANGLNGSLVIDGGTVSTGNMYVAFSKTTPRSAVGVVSVSSGTLSVGFLGLGAEPASNTVYYLAGTGSLNVSNGGVVNVRQMFVSGDKSNFSVNSGGTLSIGGGAFLVTGSTSAVNNGTIILNGTSYQYFRGSITGTGAFVKSGGLLSVE